MSQNGSKFRTPGAITRGECLKVALGMIPETSRVNLTTERLIEEARKLEAYVTTE